MPARLLITLLCSLVAVAAAQRPMLPPEFLDHTRQVQGDRIRFCVLQDSVLTDLDEAVARLLADALLLDSSIQPVNLPYHVQDLGYRLPLTSEQIFYLLSNECDALMGYLYSVGSYPEWQIVSAPYVRTEFVLATRASDAVDSLNSLPAGSLIGTQLGSAPNSRLNSFLRNQSGEPVWRRAPYPDNQILLERLVDGSVDAALVWEPALVAFGEGELHSTTDLRPLPEMDASFTITMFSSNAFLQSTLDAAISAVSADGSLSALIKDSGVPGDVPMH